MIVTVTLNPMLDKTVSVDALRRGAIQRATHVSSVVGGKGVNVSRQLAIWGEETLATGFLGGEIGAMLEHMLDEEHIPHTFIRVSSMTREGVTYLEDDGTSTGIFEPPHEVTGQESEQLVRALQGLQNNARWMVFSGSSPCAAADEVFPLALESARDQGVRTVLDSYGKTFARAVRQRPDIVKPNRQEMEQTFGLRLAGEPDVMNALRLLIDEGARTAIITDGGHACYAGSSAGIWRFIPPSVKTVNATGSGDTMIAGVVYGLTREWEFERALAFGVGAGAANAARRSVADVPLQKAETLMREVRIERLLH
jgi:1-phosphofructokinase family hexose kinase